MDEEPNTSFLRDDALSPDALVDGLDPAVTARISDLANRHRDLDTEASLARFHKKRKTRDARKKLRTVLLWSGSVAALLLLGFLIFRPTVSPSWGELVAEETFTAEEIEKRYFESGADSDPYALTLTLDNGEVFAFKKETPDTLPLGKILSVLSHGNGLGGGATLTVPVTRLAVAVLADGSRVTLDSESRLRIPEDFGTKGKREIEMPSGQAFFEAAHDPVRSFSVRAGALSIAVLGTKFNVSVRRGESDTPSATLVSGKVSAKGHKGTRALLTAPGDQVVASRDGEVIRTARLSSEELARLMGWRDGIWAFDKAALKEIMAILGRHYDFKTVFESETVAGYTLTGIIKADFTAEYALDLLSRASGFAFEYDRGHRRVTVRR